MAQGESLKVYELACTLTDTSPFIDNRIERERWMGNAEYTSDNLVQSCGALDNSRCRSLGPNLLGSFPAAEPWIDENESAI
jgi:hypothetical protein